MRLFLGRLLLAACAGALLQGCAEGPPRPPAFEHYAARARGLAEARAALDEEAPTEAPDPENVAGLVHTLASADGSMRELVLADIRSLGDGASAQLAVIAAATEGDPRERAAALELLGALDAPQASEHLVQLVEKSPESWVRAHAAWRLSSTSADWLVPRLLLRLKYEEDAETVIWIADALAAHGNYDGLAGLWRLSREAATEALRASARERLDAIAARAGLTSAEENWQLWNQGDPEGRLAQPAPSPRLVLAVWERIDQLSGEHFQLRGVDDARFVLARMGDWVTGPLCEALHDEDVYVRVHAAQCLERMGPRASAAGPTLLQALADPSLAPQAAASLGGIRYPDAQPTLVALLEEPTTSHELRVACAAALGPLGLAASIAPLERMVTDASEPADLRLAAAGALVDLGAGERGADYLLEVLADPDGDRPGAEVRLEAWLRSRDDEAARELLAAWEALDLPPGVIPTQEQAEARRAKRHELLAGAWSRLR